MSKIESRSGVDNLDDILEVTDGVIVARGDLLNTVGINNFGKSIQEINEKCEHSNVPYYIATGILESVYEFGNIPTRSEILDLYNILKGKANGFILNYPQVRDRKVFDYIMQIVNQIDF